MKIKYLLLLLLLSFTSIANANFYFCLFNNMFFNYQGTLTAEWPPSTGIPPTVISGALGEMDVYPAFTTFDLYYGPVPRPRRTFTFQNDSLDLHNFQPTGMLPCIFNFSYNADNIFHDGFDKLFQ